MKSRKDSYAVALMAAEIDQIIVNLLENGVKIKDITDELGCSDRTLMNYRNGVTEPPASTYWKIKAMSADKAAESELERFNFVTRGVKNIRKLIGL